MKKAILTACILALPLSSCSWTAKAFWNEAIRLGCRGLKKCEEDYFDEHYDNIKDCKDEAKDSCDAKEFADACPDYDRSKGADCLKELREEKRECPDEPSGSSACDIFEICGADVDDQALMECLGAEGYTGRLLGIPEAFEINYDVEDE
jgi:hypothetical protein